MDWELIWWIVVLVVCLVLIVPAFFVKDDKIDITPSTRRDWERWEKEWNK